MVNKLTISGEPVSGEHDADGPGAPGAADDPSLVSGQDPDSVFGIPLSYDTGLGGSTAPGGESLGAHDISEPNQYPNTVAATGTPLPQGTGLPGSQGAPNSNNSGGGATIMVTDPNYTSGQPGGGSGVQQVAAPVQVGGPGDSTMVTGQYPPASPTLPGQYPTDDGLGDGTILVGGFKKGQRG